MINEELRQLLSLLGLREIEMNLFAALWQSGPSRATALAQKMGISRTSVYDLLERLIDAGVAYETIEGNVKVFAAQRPEKIDFLVQEKEKQIKTGTKVIDE